MKEVTQATILDLRARANRHRVNAEPPLVAAKMIEAALEAYAAGNASEIERLSKTTDLDLIAAIRFNFHCRFCEALLAVPQDYNQYERCSCSAIYGFEEVAEGNEFPQKAAQLLGVAAEELDVVFSQEPFDTLGEEAVFVYFARVKRA